MQTMLPKLTPRPSESEQDSATVPINQTEYAQRCREVMELYRALQELGADGLFPTLPKIIVIGGQSSKAVSSISIDTRVVLMSVFEQPERGSLVEAVSGINVPRDSGTCTRVSDGMHNAQFIANLVVHDLPQLQVRVRWEQLDISDGVQFGPVITDRDTEDFMSMSTVDLRNLATTDSQILPFSRNFVQVELRDPDLTDLSFVDLPGIIHNADEDIIELVRSLVVSYIEESENTIVLITIPMSGVFFFPRHRVHLPHIFSKDPAGDAHNRSVDQAGYAQQWGPLAHGKNGERLFLDKIRGTSSNMATTVFDSRTMMSVGAIYLETNPKRPPNSFLSAPLLGENFLIAVVSVYRHFIPTLKESVNRLLTSDRAEYSTLPPPPPTDDAWSRINVLIHEFSVDVKAAVEGKDAHKKLVQRNRARYEQFKRDILGTCPNFRPFEDKTQYRDPCIWDEELAGKKTNPYIYMAASRYIMDIKDVRKEIDDCTTWELPGDVPLETTHKLIQRFTKEWSNPSMECFDAFKPLEMHIRALVRSQMEIYKSEALVMLRKAVKLETPPEFTQVLHYSMERSKWLERFHKVYRTSSTYAIRQPLSAIDSGLRPSLVSMESYAVPARESYAAPAREAYEVPVRETTEDEDALLVMAKVRAYFEMAYKRFIDNIPLTIERELHQTLSSRLYQSLIRDMGGSDALERARDLLREDPAIASRRIILQDRIARLEEIRSRLYAFR
ncbi:uncharacterized protein EV420DRAFT_1730365 [Desarmillaria tabescens]|uniref:GED domain-containing protein n=1 Tax=Armillaria tabescens TaxID=1929756 RepID=A0AA39JIV7_ARMTA|nr:uncharacterized protein EV420DRAFT_1730365 [Desarmillaria tabescens]KAK0441268.1 hypothetical protein EV420DRAFT_1730365 [Desarmillaria tabescens]